MAADCEIIRGPAWIYGSAVGNMPFYTQNDITIRKPVATFGIATDQHGPDIDIRQKDVIHQISFTPSGTWAEAQALLTPAADWYQGRKVLRRTAASITAVANSSGNSAVTFSGAVNLYKGQYITILTSSVGGYVGTWLVHEVTDTTHAVLVMTYSATATGTVEIPNCLIIHPTHEFAGSGLEKIHIYQNAGITALPDLTFSSTERLLGAVTVSAVAHPYLSPIDTGESIVRAAAWSVISTAAVGGGDAGDALSDFAAEWILTAPPRVRFAEPSVDAFDTGDTAPAPWKDFRTMSGVKVGFNLTLEADETDYRGTTNWTFAGLTAQVTLTPVGSTMTDSEVQNMLEQQKNGSIAGRMRGQSLSSVETRELLILIEPPGLGYLFRLPKAVLSGANAAHGTKVPRSGELTFNSVRPLNIMISSLFALEDS